MAKKSESYYFPGHITEKLARIPEHPVTFVEAPSGFGKTTAIREYIRRSLPEAFSRWHICLGEPPVKTWSSVCGMFPDADGQTTERLRELGPPTMETIADVSEIVRNFRAPLETFLIVDNYQLFDCAARKQIVEAFSAHDDPLLHLIFITQPNIGSNDPAKDAHGSFNVYNIAADDLLFNEDDIVRYSRMAGVTLSKEKCKGLLTLTEGWIAAISLQLMNYREHGSFVYHNDAGALVERAVWDKLRPNERDFLLSVSLLDSFSPAQAAIMHGNASLPENIRWLLRRNAFIPYSKENGMFYMHAILRNYLLERFETLPPDFAREIRARAGTACASAENYFQAAKFFRGAGDYASVISMPFTAKYIYNNFDPSMLDFFERFVKECPGRIIEERPIFLVMIAYLMFRNGKRDSFEEIARIIRRIIDGHNCLSEKEMARFRGEFALLMSFTQFNDIVGMSEYHRQALAFFESLDERPTRSIFFGGSIPWTFGCPSVFFLYWRNPGELGKELEYMEECVPIYSKITGGHGAGGGDVMRAESLLLQGDDAGAEVAAHEAIYLADSENQTGNSLCAELVLARIAILRGDAAGYASVRSGILERARGAHQRAVFLLGELSRAKLDLTLGINDNLPDWLSDINRMSGVLYVHARPYAHALYGKLLLMEGRRAELRALFRMVMGMARGMNLVLPQIYHHIYLAAADTADGNDGDAGEHLSSALGLASPDRIYLPFAEHWQYLESAFKRLETRPGEWYFPAVRALAERQTKGVRAVTALVKKSSAQVLSPREREIAALAAEGLTNPEIAERLFITRGTVKNAVARALEKTGTKSRAELAAWMMKN